MRNDLSIQGWFDFQGIYDDIVERAPAGSILVEIGVWRGASLTHLGMRAKDANKDLKVHGIDRWVHDEWDGYQAIRCVDRARGITSSIKDQCLENLRNCGVDDFVILHESDSIAAADLFQDNSVFFVFMDDTHSSEHIQKEIAAWLPKMSPDSCMAGHDYPGDIKAGVIHHFPQVEHIAGGYGSWRQWIYEHELGTIT